VISPEAVRGQRLMTMPASTNSGNMTKEIMGKYGLDMKVCMELSDVRSLLDAVLENIGIAMVMSVPVNGKNIRYLSLRGIELPEQTVELVYKSDKTLSPAMKYLVELITGQKYDLKS